MFHNNAGPALKKGLGTGLISLIGLGLLSCAGIGAAAASEPELLSQWEEEMVTEGKIRGDYLRNSGNAASRLDAVYYDAQRVFLEIADYTGDAEPWTGYADTAGDIYRTQYLEPNDYIVAGYMRFAHGNFMDWERTGDETARDRVLQLQENAAFSAPELNGTSSSWYQQRYSREIAYAIENNMLAEKTGAEPNEPRMEMLLDMALGHIDQWTSGNFIGSDPQWHFVQSFMTGLTASALIDYQEHAEAEGRPDHRIEPAIAKLTAWLWENMWVEDVGGSPGAWNTNGGTGQGAFRYVSPTTEGVGTTNPAPDLNMLIAPMFAWMYKQTGDQQYLEKADKIFNGGVAMASIDDGKRFNQSYRTSFTFLRFRDQGTELWGG